MDLYHRSFWICAQRSADLVSEKVDAEKIEKVLAAIEMKNMLKCEVKAGSILNMVYIIPTYNPYCHKRKGKL